MRYGDDMGVIDELRKAVIGSGMTRYAISKSAGLDQGALCRFAAGSGLSVASAEKLADALGFRLALEVKDKRRATPRQFKKNGGR